MTVRVPLEQLVRPREPWTTTLGYHRDPEATAQLYRNCWLHTGDAFRYDEQGVYYFVDRIKDAIRRRGENISSFQVESAVNAHPAVLESAAIAVPSEHTEDEVCVYAVPRPNMSVDEAELRAFLAERLPRFMQPRDLYLVDSLPKTAVGKVLRRELRS